MQQFACGSSGSGDTGWKVLAELSCAGDNKRGDMESRVAIPPGELVTLLQIATRHLPESFWKILQHLLKNRTEMGGG